MTDFTPSSPLPPLLAALAASAQAAGIDAYVVGGTVRDALLGRPTRDIDVAAGGDAMAWARAVAAEMGARFVPLDERGVARIVFENPAGAYVDVAALQGTLEHDLRRRDFTVDALAVPLGGSRVIDICGGLADLDARLLRMNGAYVFDDDPLRLLRAVRVASEIGFAIDPSTAAAIQGRAPHVARAAAERRRDELARILALERAEPAVRLLDGLGLLAVLLPELAAGKGVAQPPRFHVYDVFEHNIHCLAALDAMLAKQQPAATGESLLWDVLWDTFGWSESDLRAYLASSISEGRNRAALLKLAALLHDVSKPETRTVGDDGRVRFYGHAEAGAAVVRRVMRRLRFGRAEIDFVATLVGEHLRPVQLAQAGEAPSRRALYRFYRALGDATPAVLLLALADAAAARGPLLTLDGWSRQVVYMNGLLVRSIEEEGIVHPPRLLTGDDIMSALGVSGGPEIGRLIAALAEAQAAGDVRSRDEALAFVKELAREGSGAGR